MKVPLGYLNAPFSTQCSATFFYWLFFEVVQKLIDWGADVNQLRFDTDVSQAALVEDRAGRGGEIQEFFC